MVNLSWQDMYHWLEVTQRELPLWNVEVLKNMSRAYVAEYHAAQDIMRPMPYREATLEITEELRAKVGQQTKSIFAEMKARQNNQG